MLNQAPFPEPLAGATMPPIRLVQICVLGRELMAPLAVRRPSPVGRTTCIKHVFDVRFPRICPEMHGVAAEPTFDARVTDLQPLGNLGLVGNHPRDDVRPQNSTVFPRGLPVSSIPISSARPQPAGVISATTIESQQHPVALAHVNGTNDTPAAERATVPEPTQVVGVAPTPICNWSFTVIDRTSTLTHGAASASGGAAVLGLCNQAEDILSKAA